VRAGDLLDALRASAAPLTEVDAPRKAGVYACFLDHPSALPSLPDQGADPLYVGVSSDLAEREFDTHFRSGQSGFSTLRRSLGALLRNELRLRAQPRGTGGSDSNYRCYRFDDVGEDRLTAWMREHLQVGVQEWAEPVAIEKDLIELAQPSLNLIGWPNPHAAEIKALRKGCVEEARRDHLR
jgi:hypothetical protein